MSLSSGELLKLDSEGQRPLTAVLLSRFWCSWRSDLGDRLDNVRALASFTHPHLNKFRELFHARRVLILGIFVSSLN
jgi:hypothetical protein